MRKSWESPSRRRSSARSAYLSGLSKLTNFNGRTDSEDSCLRSVAPAQHTHSVLNGQTDLTDDGVAEAGPAVTQNLPLEPTAAQAELRMNKSELPLSRRGSAARYVHQGNGREHTRQLERPAGFDD
jgi:hypothetical protein